ncbi:chemotaxis protein CheW [Thiorhodococcus fuscus]|uniref:Chemotaxis protein CheW n=1 Tax=Thiorhodococcus fuscus TaxID=527200 RepID=A0ABW4YC20_9GAMM
MPGRREESALGLQKNPETEWLLPTEALSRFRLPEGTSFDQARQPQQQVRYGFRVGSLNLLIKPRAASEVIAMAPVAAIPNSAPWLLGMINLRSNLVPVFDLAMICALDRQHTGRGHWILVLDKGESAVAILIDAQPVALSRLTHLAHLPSMPTALRSAVAGGFRVEQDVWLEFDHQAFFLALSDSAANAAR